MVGSAVSAVEYRHFYRFQVVIVNVFGVADDYAVDAKCLERPDGVVESFTFLNGTRGEVERQRSNAEVYHRHLEAVLRSGGVFIKKVDHFLPGEVD